MLDRAVAEKVVPKIFFSNTSYEYWGRAAALIHVTADGKRDAPISDNVRIYHFTGLQHFSGPFPPEKGKGDLLGQQPQSPLPIKYFWRAMIANMDAWVRSNTLPPPSSYPKIADGTLVPLREYAFPAIPGVNRPHEANEAWRLDFGPNWREGILSTPAAESWRGFPRARAPGRCRWQRARRRALAGDHRSPGDLCGLESARSLDWRARSARRLRGVVSAISQRRRRSVRRQATHASRSRNATPVAKTTIVRYYKDAIDELVKQRWILPEDREALLHRGEQEWSEATKGTEEDAPSSPRESRAR